MPVLDINLLQKEQRRVSRLSQATWAVAVATGSIVGLMLLLAVFLFTTIAIRNGQKDGLIKQREGLEQRISGLDRANSPFYPDMKLADQAKAYQGQIQAAKTLVDNHKYFTLYLSEISDNTPASIVYTSFTADSVNRLSVAGNADSYQDVAKLVESFKKLSFAKNATLQEAKLDQTKLGKGGAVEFTMLIELKSAAELKKLPVPTGEGQAQTGTPRPQTTPGPSPAASPRATAAPNPFAS